MSCDIFFGGKHFVITYEDFKDTSIEYEICKCLKKYNTMNYNKNKNYPDGIVQILGEYDEDVICSNPSTHFEVNNGFGMYLPRMGKIFYLKEDIPRVVYIPDKFRIKKNYPYKIVDREFKHPYEYFCQIIHELLLVPAILLLFDDSIVIHGSAILDTESNRLIVFSGTGGVGKTFLEMKFILKNRFYFFADDMVIIDKNFKGHPNLAWPKIYRYNVSQLPELEKYISKNYGFLSKLHWKVYPHLPYIGKYCRRTLNPLIFIGDNITPTKVSEIYFLFRLKNGDNISFLELSPKLAAELSFQIIKSEYHQLFRHISYHIYNRLSIGMNPTYTEMLIKDKYIKLFSQSQSKFYLVKVSPEVDLNALYKILENKIFSN